MSESKVLAYFLNRYIKDCAFLDLWKSLPRSEHAYEFFSNLTSKAWVSLLSRFCTNLMLLHASETTSLPIHISFRKYQPTPSSLQKLPAYPLLFTETTSLPSSLYRNYQPTPSSLQKQKLLSTWWPRWISWLRLWAIPVGPWSTSGEGVIFSD